MTLPFRYGDTCSGVSAATLAFSPLGWEAAFYAEIAPQPCHVLYHRFGASRPLNMPDPDEADIGFKERRRRINAIRAVRDLPAEARIINYGDFTRIEKHHEPIDLLIGGTPCQDFSIAGLRAGLAGARGNLSLEFLKLADRMRPRWLVWENVPGVLSQDGGRAFGAIIGGMVELGYGIAYRVLDAQYVRVDGYPGAVPQRRQRVIVVGYLGDWRRAAAVLFERAGLLGDSAPRRQTGKGTAPTLASRSSAGGGLGTDFDLDGGLIADAYVPDIMRQALTAKIAKGSSGPSGDEYHHLIAFGCKDSDPFQIDDGSSPTLRGMAHGDSHQNGGGRLRSRSDLRWRVRRLTPLECERLQGYPDNHTLVDYRGKPMADGPRYKMCGNGFAANKMRWIGRRIQMVDALS